MCVYVFLCFCTGFKWFAGWQSKINWFVKSARPKYVVWSFLFSAAVQSAFKWLLFFMADSRNAHTHIYIPKTITNRNVCHICHELGNTRQKNAPNFLFALFNCLNNNCGLWKGILIPSFFWVRLFKFQHICFEDRRLCCLTMWQFYGQWYL